MGRGGGPPMQSSHVRLALLLIPCLLAAGCGNTDDGVRPCDLWTASAVISGRVMNSSGARIASAPVEVQVASSSGCNGSEVWAHTKQVTTDASGNYSVEMELGN